MNHRHVSALVDEVEAAWNNHDMRRFSGCFSSDADFVNGVGTWWHGRGEIEDAHTASHAGHFRDSTLTATLAAYKEVAASVAVAHVTWELSGHGPSGKEQTRETRHGIWTWVVCDGGAQPEIVASQNTDRPNH